MNLALAILVASAVVADPGPVASKNDPAVNPAATVVKFNQPVKDPAEKKTAPAPRTLAPRPQPALPQPPAPAAGAPSSKATTETLYPPIDPKELTKSLSTVALFGLVSLAPVALLMLTAFVRINIVLVLLRQALGSPQVPGNQVLTALALLLTALVMRPVGELVYKQSIEPFSQGRYLEAFDAGSRPIKAFMIEQIKHTNHQNYLWAIYDETATAGRPDPVYVDEFPLGVVATAFLLSELTTALVIGFYIYLPFLVVDLVVSSVLAAMGLFMLPPSLVALPLKLILFVLVNGWLNVATMLLQTFSPVGASP